MKNNNEIALRQSRCCIEWYRELLFFKLNDITTCNSALLGVHHPLLDGSCSSDVDDLLCTGQISVLVHLANSVVGQCFLRETTNTEYISSRPLAFNLTNDLVVCFLEDEFCLRHVVIIRCSVETCATCENYCYKAAEEKFDSFHIV